MTVSMHEAKTHLSRLVKKAGEGEEIIVTNRGQPVAAITSYSPETPSRKPGFFKTTRPMCSGKEWQRMKNEVLEDFDGKTSPSAP